MLFIFRKKQPKEKEDRADKKLKDVCRYFFIIIWTPVFQARYKKVAVQDIPTFLRIHSFKKYFRILDNEQKK